MHSRHRTASTSHVFERALLILGVFAFMYLAAEVLKPLALAVLLSFALAPAARLFERVGLPRVVAVAFTVVLTLGFLCGIGYVVGGQLALLAKRLPDYQENIEAKLNHLLKPELRATGDRLQGMVDRVAAELERPASAGQHDPVPVQKVKVVADTSIQDRLRVLSELHPELLGFAGLVLVLVAFLLMHREDLSDRIVALFGHRHVSIASRTLEEIAQRISRYLATFALVNSGFGLVIGLGLWLIGVPYAVLWGCLAALLRFIPYVGPAVAFALPLVFSFAHFAGWREPLEVVGLFGVVEVALNSFLEPVIYGRATGVLALSLLVAAMFWTWLWGTLGLLLSTPLTVCLAVLGKYVPSLRSFATLLGEDAELEPHVRFYQRLVALDREGSLAIVDAALAEKSRVEVFDGLLIPTLSLAKRDALRAELDEAERVFVWQVIGEVVDRPEGESESHSTETNGAGRGEAGTRDAEHGLPRSTIVGLAVDDAGDALVLRMLRQILASLGIDLEVLEAGESPLTQAEQVAELSPGLVIVSHLPPKGLTLTRYMVRRLRTQCNGVPVVVGRWGRMRGGSSAAERLVAVGASRVVFTLAEARDRIVGLAAPHLKRDVQTAPLPA